MSYGPPCSSFSTRVPWVSPAVEREDSWELVDPEPVEEQPDQLPIVPASGPLLKAQGEVPVLHLSLQTELDLERADERKLRDFVFEVLEPFYLSPELRCSRTEAVYRVARAVRAGLGARQKYSGVTQCTLTSPSIRCANRWYVCLRAPSLPAGFITQDYRRYRALVQDRAGNFHRSGVSHAFPTLIEVAAFLAGSQFQWPQDLQ